MKSRNVGLKKIASETKVAVKTIREFLSTADLPQVA